MRRQAPFKRKFTLKDYMEAQQRDAASGIAEENTGMPSSTQHVSRTLLRQHLQPLIDLVYSDSTDVQRDATGLLGTLALNANNIDILIDSGALKPLLTMAGSADPPIRRAALSGLAHMTSREDIRMKLCSVPGGLRQTVAGIGCNDVPSRLAAAECIANIASSYKLRGQLVDPKVGGLPALLSLIISRVPELKRWGMVALQRLAVCRKSNVALVTTRDDPEGDGYADEIMAAGALQPLLQLLKGGATIEEDLRTHAMNTVYLFAEANDDLKRRLGEHPMLMKTVVDLLLLDEHPGGATQREACRTVQLLSTADDNLYAMIGAGLMIALSMLARTDHLLKKQFAATMLLRIASEAGCRQPLLDAGGARTLCFLCRSSLPRKIIKPAANAITQMCTCADCVPALLDAGSGAVLATIASSSDPELRKDGCKALTDMITSACGEEEASISAGAPPSVIDDGLKPHSLGGRVTVRITDQLLQQGALAIFFAAATTFDRQLQLHASRGLRVIAQQSPLYARILARKGAARALSALLLSSQEVLRNTVIAIQLMAEALGAPPCSREPLTVKRLCKVRGVLEVGVVGSLKELWARLNDDAGMPAAQLIRLARTFEGPLGDTGEKSRAVLRMLKPGLLEQLEIDDPARTGHSIEAVAERTARSKMISKIQSKYRTARRLSCSTNKSDAFTKPTASSKGGGGGIIAVLRTAKLGDSKWAAAWGSTSAVSASVVNAKVAGVDALTKLKAAAQLAREAEANTYGPTLGRQRKDNAGAKAGTASKTESNKLELKQRESDVDASYATWSLTSSQRTILGSRLQNVRTASAMLSESSIIRP